MPKQHPDDYRRETESVPRSTSESFIRRNAGTLIVALLTALILNGITIWRDRILSDEANRQTARIVDNLVKQMRVVQDVQLSHGKDAGQFERRLDDVEASVLELQRRIPLIPRHP